MKWTNFVVNFDRRMASWMGYYGHRLLRYSVAIIFIWFGLLKPLGMSPAADLVANTVYWFPPDVFVPILGWWEVAIGVGLLFRPLVRMALFLLFLQMPGTALPLLLLPRTYPKTSWEEKLEIEQIAETLRNTTFSGFPLGAPTRKLGFWDRLLTCVSRSSQWV